MAKTRGQEMVVCFLDILGFSARSLNRPDEAEEAARNFRTKLKENILLPKKKYFNVPKFSVISDSVFISLPIVSQKNSMFDVEYLVKDLSNTLLDCLKEGIPLRGSISIGNAYHERADRENIMSGDHLVGVPVTRAAIFEQEQEWVGISFIPELFGSEPNVLNNLIDKGVVVKWAVPTEPGLQKTWVVKWPEKGLDDTIKMFDTYYRQYLHPDKKDKQKPKPKVAAKYYSTLVFLQHQKDKLGSADLSKSVGGK